MTRPGAASAPEAPTATVAAMAAANDADRLRRSEDILISHPCRRGRVRHETPSRGHGRKLMAGDVAWRLHRGKRVCKRFLRLPPYPRHTWQTPRIFNKNREKRVGIPA